MEQMAETYSAVEATFHSSENIKKLLNTEHPKLMMYGSVVNSLC